MARAYLENLHHIPTTPRGGANSRARDSLITHRAWPRLHICTVSPHHTPGHSGFSFHTLPSLWLSWPTKQSESSSGLCACVIQFRCSLTCYYAPNTVQSTEREAQTRDVPPPSLSVRAGELLYPSQLPSQTVQTLSSLNFKSLDIGPLCTQTQLAFWWLIPKVTVTC